MRAMSKWERVEAALHGGEVDRVPVSLWKHYHLQDRAPRRLAQATVALHRQFDTDLIKLTPSGLYPIQDWGATISFGADDDAAPVAVTPTVASAAEWPALRELDVSVGALGRELETIAHLAGMLEGSAPFMMTIFSPLTIAQKLAGDRVVEDLRQSPRQLHAGLAIITQVVRRYGMACLDAGAPGFFFATQLADRSALSPAEYREFGVRYDLDALDAVQGRSRVTMLHVCRREIMFDLVADYPVHLINWADRAGPPSLSEARRLTARALAGGLSLETLLSGSEDDVQRETRDAIAQAGRRGFVLAPACVIRGPSPDANLAAARHAVDA
jgi:uroporphyrinogen decarboxylase